MEQRERDGWIPASVGCHWTKGAYTISTISRGNRHGYAVYHNRVQLGAFLSWDEAVALTE